MKIREIVNALERLAPLALQESWDNAGLQVGLVDEEARGVLVSLDVTEQVVREAVARGCNVVVSHHPLLFRGVKRLTGATDVERALIWAVKHDVVVVSMHTNLDNAPGGVNWKIAEKLGLHDVGFFARKTVDGIDCGSGVVGLLPQPMESSAFVALVKQTLEARYALCNELLERPVSKVAVCGGAGDFLLDDAIREGADAFITGEMHYHQYFGHEQEIQICVVGHWETEHFTSELLRDAIRRDCPGVACEVADTQTNPIKAI